MKLIRPWLFLGILACVPAFAQDYEIRIHRPLHEGDKYKLSVKSHDSQDFSVTRDGEVDRSSKSEITAELEAVVTVLAVDNGKPVKESVAISKLIRTEKGRTNSVFKEETTVIASFEEGKKAFTVNGRKADMQEHQVLELVVDIEKPGPNDDEIFGTHERKKVGDSWPANAKLLSELVDANGPVSKDASGKATLKEVIKDAGGPVLLISTEFNATPIIPFPPGVITDRAELKAALSGKYPVDVARGRPEDTVDLSVTVHAKGKPAPDGPVLEFNLRGNQSSVYKRTPIR